MTVAHLGVQGSRQRLVQNVTSWFRFNHKAHKDAAKSAKIYAPCEKVAPEYFGVAVKISRKVAEPQSSFVSDIRAGCLYL